MKFENRTTELIALGASVAANCQSCVEYHGRKAAEYGIDSDEVAQAIEIGRAVRKGAGAKVDQVADGLLQKDSSAASASPSAGAPPSGTGCCGSVAANPTTGADERGESPWFTSKCAPFSSMMTGAWRSGGFPFPGQPEAKS